MWSRDGTVAERSLHSTWTWLDRSVPTRHRAVRIGAREGYREAYQFTDAGDCVLAGRSRTADLEAMARFKAWLFAAGGAVLTIGLGGGWWLTSRAIRPVEEISAAASRISAGHLSDAFTSATRTASSATSRPC